MEAFFGQKQVQWRVYTHKLQYCASEIVKLLHEVMTSASSSKTARTELRSRISNLGVQGAGRAPAVMGVEHKINTRKFQQWLTEVDYTEELSTTFAVLLDKNQPHWCLWFKSAVMVATETFHAQVWCDEQTLDDLSTEVACELWSRWIDLLYQQPACYYFFHKEIDTIRQWFTALVPCLVDEYVSMSKQKACGNCSGCTRDLQLHGELEDWQGSDEDTEDAESHENTPDEDESADDGPEASRSRSHRRSRTRTRARTRSRAHTSKNTPQRGHTLPHSPTRSLLDVVTQKSRSTPQSSTGSRSRPVPSYLRSRTKNGGQALMAQMNLVQRSREVTQLPVEPSGTTGGVSVLYSPTRGTNKVRERLTVPLHSSMGPI